MNRLLHAALLVLSASFSSVLYAQAPDLGGLLKGLKGAVKELEKQPTNKSTAPQPGNQPPAPQAESATQSHIMGADSILAKALDSHEVALLAALKRSDDDASKRRLREIRIEPRLFDEPYCVSTDKFVSIKPIGMAIANYATEVYGTIVGAGDHEHKYERYLMSFTTANCNGRTVKQIADFISSRSKEFSSTYANAVQAKAQENEQKMAEARTRKQAAEEAAEKARRQREEQEQQERMAAEKRKKEAAAADAKFMADRKARLAEIRKNYALAKSCIEVVEALMDGNVSFTDGLLPSVQPSKGLMGGMGDLDLFEENKVFSGGKGYVNAGDGVFAEIKTDRSTTWIGKNQVRIGASVVVIGKYVDNTKLTLTSGRVVQAPVLELVCISPR